MSYENIPQFLIWLDLIISNSYTNSYFGSSYENEGYAYGYLPTEKQVSTVSKGKTDIDSL